MDATETKIAEALAAQMNECERGTIAIRADGQAGLALVAPNLLVHSFILANGLLIADCWCN